MKTDHASDLIYDHVIDCNVLPQTPKGWKIKQHIRDKPMYWDSETEMIFFLSKNQKGGKTITGHALQRELEGRHVMSANVLDHWLVHPDLIPLSCKDKFIFFWGTTYVHSDGSQCVRFLRNQGNVWYSDCRWLGGEFDCVDLAALVD